MSIKRQKANDKTLSHHVYGPKPSWEGIKNTDESFSQRFSKALNWANEVFKAPELKQETLKYLESNNKEIGNLETLPDYKFLTVGKLAWLHNEGCPLDEIRLHKLDNSIKLLQENKSASPIIAELEASDSDRLIIKGVLKSKAQVTLYNKAKDVISDIINQIDSVIINNKKLDEQIIHDQLLKDKVNIKITDQIYEQLKHQFKGYEQEKKSLERLEEDVIKLQFDTNDNYERYVANIKANIEHLLNAINQVGSYLGNKKALKKSERRGRKAKIKSPGDQISKLKYKTEDTEFKLVSIDPSSVIGAQTLVIFNTKNRKLGIYSALDDKGLEIKGTTLQNYNEDLSMQKIIRKPEMIPQFSEGNIRRVFVIFNENIRAKKQSLNGRLNQHTILLRTFKEKFPTE